jgi:carboxyl-terminal processing protease
MSEPLSQIPLDSPVSKKDVLTPILLSVAVVLGIGVGMKLKNEPLVSVSTKEKTIKPDATDMLGQGRIEEILRYVNAKYVDGVNDKAMIDKSVNSLLQELDPHSIYIPSDALKEVNEDLEGEFEGIGIESILLDDTLRIVTPLSNSPAANAGLATGDKILAIGDSSAIGKNMRWLHEKLRGKKGTIVKVGIQKEGETKVKTVSLNRDRVPVHAVDVATTLDNRTGYIKISRFSQNTTREFLQGMEKLFEKKNVKDLVIDLRQNPGGYLDKAVDILSQLFKDKDKLLVYTKGRTVHRNEYKSTGRSRYEVGNVAILIDEGSASASEIVAGAVQDWDRGIVVGRRSFGKGLVQEPYILKDGSELRLTVARYYTPTGRSIQKPYKGKTKKEYTDEEDKRFENGALTQEEPDPQTDSSRYYTAAGRLVYGGGGVKPDVFVPIDPVFKNDYFNQLKPWIQEYAYRYYSTYRKDLKFGDWQEYQRNFKISDYALNDFIKYSERQEVNKSTGDLPSVKEPVKRLLKARIARLMFGEEGYYGILNDYDPMIARTLEVLKQNDPLNLGKIARKQ